MQVHETPSPAAIGVGLWDASSSESVPSTVYLNREPASAWVSAGVNIHSNIHEGLEDRRRYTTPESSGPVVRTYARMFVFSNPNLFYSDRSISREPELYN